MANVSAKQNTPTEANAFREYLRPFMFDGVTFRMTPYKIGQAFADATAESVRMDFKAGAAELVAFVNGDDAEFRNYAQGYMDRALELVADNAEYAATLKVAFKMGA
jgi:hypothetical protein